MSAAAPISRDDRSKALTTAIQAIERQHGKGAVMRLGDRGNVQIDTISTGSIAIDIATGIGGVPRGRIVEIYGPESSGKTTLALQIAAEAQKAGGVAAMVDAEHALDPEYAAKLGVNVDELLIAQPDNGEAALEIVDKLVASRAVDLIIVDSVAALVPKAEIEGEMGDSHVGLHARLMSQALRKLTGAVHNSNTTVVFINQIRMKIGVMFGSPETTTGGNALKFYASMRIDIRRIGSIKEKDIAVANEVKVRVIKNKLAPPFKEARTELWFGRGFSQEGELIELGVEDGIIDKSGSWFSYGDQRLGQGKEKVRDLLSLDPDLKEAIKRQVLARRLPARAPKESAGTQSDAQPAAQMGSQTGAAA